MDGVEMLMLAEERFGIEITDDEAAQIRTPGMFIEVIFGKLQQATASRCQSQRGFYLLRRGLVSISGADRKSVEPESSIRSFVGQFQERQFWEMLHNKVNARSWPGLGYARSMETVGKVAFIAFCVCGLAMGWRLGLLSSAGGIVATILFLGLFVPAILMALITRVFNGHRNFIPTRITSVRDLIPYVATSDTLVWSREDVARGVREIVEDVLAPGAKYGEEADFVRELGLS